MKETSEILNKLLRKNMITTEKIFATILKDIDTAFYIIDVKLASKSSRKYSIVKANYYYGKVEKNIKK